MDRSLDDSIKARQRNSKSSTDRRPPRDGIRKSYRRDDNHNLDQDWVHDRYEGDFDGKPASRGLPSVRLTRRDHIEDSNEAAAKLRLENLHWDLSEDDLQELFSRIGPIQSINIVYDRQDRSTGIAYVVYPDIRDARTAIQEFDGANANGQPIKLSLVPIAPAKPARNPFDTAERPSRSLFDRIDESERRRRATESEDDVPAHRSNVSKPPPDHIDRYVPGQDGNNRRRSPRRNTDRGSRRPGQRRQRDVRDAEGHVMVQGRPRKTAEELDAEMADYWSGNRNGEDSAPGEDNAPPANGDGDVDMDS